MATNSPSNVEPLLLTGCLSMIGSTDPGINRHAPAPQGPGFPSQEPSVNPTAVSVSHLSISPSIIYLDSFCCSAVLVFDEPRVCLYSVDIFVGCRDSRKLNSFSKLCREMSVFVDTSATCT